MTWHIKLCTHVELQVKRLNIDKQYIYLYVDPFITKKQNLRMKVTARSMTDTVLGGRGYTDFSSRALSSHRRLLSLEGEGGKHSHTFRSPETRTSLSFSQWLPISRSIGFCLIFIISLTICSALGITLGWEKVLSAPSQVSLFLTLWHPKIARFLSRGEKGRTGRRCEARRARGCGTGLTSVRREGYA